MPDVSALIGNHRIVNAAAIIFQRNQSILGELIRPASIPASFRSLFPAVPIFQHFALKVDGTQAHYHRRLRSKIFFRLSHRLFS